MRCILSSNPPLFGLTSSGELQPLSNSYSAAKLTALQAAHMRASAEASGELLTFDAKFDGRGQFKLAQEQIYKHWNH